MTLSQSWPLRHRTCVLFASTILWIANAEEPPSTKAQQGPVPWFRAISAVHFPKLFSLDLDPYTFRATLNNMSVDYLLVDFYAPWCPICQHFFTDFERLALVMQREHTQASRGPTVAAAVMDCTRYAKTCIDWGVTAYPYLLFGKREDWLTQDPTKLKFVDAKPRTADGVSFWIKNSSGVDIDIKPASVSKREILNYRLSLTEKSSTDQVQANKSFALSELGIVEHPTTVDIWDVQIATALLIHNAIGGRLYVNGSDVGTKKALLDLVELLVRRFPETVPKQYGLKMCESSFKDLHGMLKEPRFWDPDAIGAGVVPYRRRDNDPNAPMLLFANVAKVEYLWRLCGTDYDDYKTGWKSCKGLWASTRGFTCGLWNLFHVLAARMDDTTAGEETDVLRNSIWQFFDCEDCRQHFWKIPFDRATIKTKRDAQLWFWNAHNMVNRRVKRIEEENMDGDPMFPKHQWPRRDQCKKCRSRPQESTNIAQGMSHEIAKGMNSFLEVEHVIRESDDKSVPTTPASGSSVQGEAATLQPIKSVDASNVETPQARAIIADAEHTQGSFMESEVGIELRSLEEAVAAEKWVLDEVVNFLDTFYAVPEPKEGEHTLEALLRQRDNEESDADDAPKESHSSSSSSAKTKDVAVAANLAGSQDEKKVQTSAEVAPSVILADQSNPALPGTTVTKGVNPGASSTEGLSNSAASMKASAMIADAAKSAQDPSALPVKQANSNDAVDSPAHQAFRPVAHPSRSLARRPDSIAVTPEATAYTAVAIEKVVRAALPTGSREDDTAHYSHQTRQALPMDDGSAAPPAQAVDAPASSASHISSSSASNGITEAASPTVMSAAALDTPRVLAPVAPSYAASPEKAVSAFPPAAPPATPADQSGPQVSSGSSGAFLAKNDVAHPEAFSARGVADSHMSEPVPPTITAPAALETQRYLDPVAPAFAASPAKVASVLPPAVPASTPSIESGIDVSSGSSGTFLAKNDEAFYPTASAPQGLAGSHSSEARAWTDFVLPSSEVSSATQAARESESFAPAHASRTSIGAAVVGDAAEKTLPAVSTPLEHPGEASTAIQASQAAMASSGPVSSAALPTELEHAAPERSVQIGGTGATAPSYTPQTQAAAITPPGRPLVGDASTALPASQAATIAGGLVSSAAFPAQVALQTAVQASTPLGGVSSTGGSAKTLGVILFDATSLTKPDNAGPAVMAPSALILPASVASPPQSIASPVPAARENVPVEATPAQTSTSASDASALLEKFKALLDQVMSLTKPSGNGSPPHA
eukprot:TRINITY_DN25319_c0_g6_i1.p1 TRINITY_DN25319_c0_g6~~TRINITY_DN25319_c0_g6_i1.p1  ORF type:complete len:1278 (-),score=147.87 TRINITY_DN25319_c0_g6_i1:55-3888(-)